MGNVPLRRFVDLEVDEVSLVDSPANEKEFAILKRMEEHDMADDVKEVIEKATSNDEGSEEKTVEEEIVEKETVEEETVKPEDVANEAVEKALDKVTELIDSIAKKANEKNEETPVTIKEEPEEKVEKEVESEEKVEEVEKEVELEEEVEVEKAKRFTPRRIQAIREAAEVLQSLVGEIAEPVLEPEKEETTKSVETESDEIFKSLSTTLGELRDGIKAFKETTKSLDERIEAIEKARQPSKSVEAEGGTDSEVKKEKNLWKGLL